MGLLGYPMVQAGNLIETPGATLEVADVCSGLKKTVALLAFALLCGYVMRARPLARVLLVLGAAPIALVANALRISGLIAVATAGGTRALEAAHNWAETGVLVVAFALFAALGEDAGMQGPAVLRLTALALALGGLAANHAVGRLPVATCHLLPVETFPRRVGEWVAVEDRPMAAEARKQLRPARSVDRTYVDSRGLRPEQMRPVSGRARLHSCGKSARCEQLARAIMPNVPSSGAEKALPEAGEYVRCRLSVGAPPARTI